MVSEVEFLDITSPLFDISKCVFNGIAILSEPWIHQLASVQAMHNHETKKQTVVVGGDDMDVKLHIGIAGDPPGGGKTLVALMLAFYTDRSEELRAWVPQQSYMDSMAHASIADFSEKTTHVASTIVVAPHQLIGQWEREATEKIGAVKGVDFEVFHSFRHTVAHVESLKRESIDLVVSGAARVVFMTPVAYTDFSRNIDLKHTVFERLIFDEADSTANLPNAVLVQSLFMWLVTATHDCFLTTSKSKKARTGVFNSIFKPVIASTSHGAPHTAMHNAIAQCCVVVNRPEFVHQSTGTPDVVYRELEVNPIMKVLQEISPSSVKDVISGMHSPTKLPTILLDMHSSVNRRLAFLNLDGNVCRLCLTEFDEATVRSKFVRLQCCNAVVHVDVLAAYAACMPQACPVCISSCLVQNNVNGVVAPRRGNVMYGLKYDPTVAKQGDATAVMPLMRGWVTALSVFGAVSAIIRDRPRASIIIFQDKINESSNLRFVLEDLGVSFSFLTGTAHTKAKTLHKFREREIRVLILSSINQAAGLNLQFTTTHIVCMHKMDDDHWKQLVARGNRYPRKKPLVVYHMQPTAMMDSDSDCDTEYEEED